MLTVAAEDLKQSTWQESSLIEACGSGNLETVRELLLRADVNGVDGSVR